MDRSILSRLSQQNIAVVTVMPPDTGVASRVCMVWEGEAGKAGYQE